MGDKTLDFWKRIFHKGGFSPSLKLQEDPHDGAASRALKNVVAPRVAEPAPAPVNGHAVGQPTAPAFTPAPPWQPAPAEAGATDDTIIHRFEPLVAHAPRNIKVLTILAAAYARKKMFDKSLSLYQHALQVVGGKNAAIEKAMAETTMKKYDSELSGLDPKSPDYAAQHERIQNQRLEYQWHEMAEPR